MEETTGGAGWFGGQGPVFWPKFLLARGRPSE